MRQITRGAVLVVAEPMERRLLFAVLDPTWNQTGIQHQPFPTDDNSPDQIGVESLGVQSDGKVLALVVHRPFDDIQQPGFTYSMTRYNTDGSVDSSFGTAGTVQVTDGAAG